MLVAKLNAALGTACPGSREYESYAADIATQLGKRKDLEKPFVQEPSYEKGAAKCCVGVLVEVVERRSDPVQLDGFRIATLSPSLFGTLPPGT